jgi:hypothetical protein
MYQVLAITCGNTQVFMDKNQEQNMKTYNP